MDVVSEYLKNLSAEIEFEAECDFLRAEFIKDFPKESILSLPIDNYLIAKYG